MKKKILFLLIAAFSVGISLNAQNMKKEVPTISAFPTGNENVGFQQHFTGKSWLAPLTSNKDRMYLSIMSPSNRVAATVGTATPEVRFS